MARLNTANKNTKKTHEGASAFGHLKPIQELRRAVLSCLLWEDQFYENGTSIADRIEHLASQVTPQELGGLAIEARKVFNLRHVPLLLLDALSKYPVNSSARFMANATERVISRADELTELLAIHWRKGKRPVPRQMRKGLAQAFAKFDEYGLAKYDRNGAVKLRDVLRIARPKPVSAEQSALWAKVKNRTLTTPDTWETQLSAGADKKETFERLITEGKLGYFALLRNLRGMAEAKVDAKLVRQAILDRKNGADKILPFRFVAAARACPQFEAELDISMAETIKALPALEGTTVILVDVSGSMDEKMSGKSDMKRIDAAAALGAIFPGQIRLFTFSNSLVEVPPRRGMAGVDAIIKSQHHCGTNLGSALKQIVKAVPFDRLVVITDEQSTDTVTYKATKPSYLINVASYQNGIGYGNGWVHIDGFSEGVLRFIYEYERNND